MPTYLYKAVTKNNQIVSNRVEEINKFVLLKKLKNNDLLPIKVTQINTRLNNSSTKKQKKNIERSDSILKEVRNQEISNSMKSRSQRFKQKAKQVLLTGQKIKNRDLVIFTQNFYLLKKANFNNIHALSTIIETVENSSLKAIIEDILLGVESRRKHVYYYGILYRSISTNIY